MPGTSDGANFWQFSLLPKNQGHPPKGTQTSHGSPVLLLERKHHPFPVGCIIYMILYIYVYTFTSLLNSIHTNIHLYACACA